MTATEKRGFRLPWGSGDHKPDEAEVDPVSRLLDHSRAESLTPSTDLAPAIAATTPGASVRTGSGLRRSHDDLGRGPFDLEPSEPDEPEAAPAPAADTGAAEPATVAEPSADAPADPPADGLVAWPDIDRAGSAKHRASDAPPPPRPALVVAGEPGAAPRRTNPLMAGLVKAMRDAARSAREEATTRMRSDAAARLVEIRTQAATASLALRKQADDDLAKVREWSKSEAARIRKETDDRIAARRGQLATQVADHATETERLQAEVTAAITTFEGEMDRFFEMLLKEEDPARLATLAERLPEAPSFARPNGPAAAKPDAARPRAARVAGGAPATPRRRTAASPRQTQPSERLAPDAAAAAEAEAIAGLEEEPVAAPTALDDDLTATAGAPELAHDPQPQLELEATPIDTPTEAPAAMPEPAAVSAVDVDDDTPSEPDAPAGSLAAVLATAPRIDSPDDLSPEERIALLGFDEPEPSDDDAGDMSAGATLGESIDHERGSHAARPVQQATPVAPEVLEDVTRIVVTGLTTVAGISAFKSALAGVSGVVSVSVTSGVDGDFDFSVVHGVSTDLARAIGAFPAFDARMTLDEGSVVSFVVSEPAT